MVSTEMRVSLAAEELRDILFNPVLDEAGTEGWRVIETRGLASVGLVPAITEFMRKSTGCGSVNYTSLSLTAKDFAPVQLKGGVSFCAEDLQTTIFQAARNAGVKRSEVTGTVFESLLLETVINGITSDIKRMAWLGNTGAASGAYNAFNGIWKQAIADGSITPYTSANSGSALSAGDSITILGDLYSGANTSPELLEAIQSGQYGMPVFHVSPSVYINYLEYLETVSGVEGAYRLLQDGTRVLTFRGCAVINHAMWNTTNCAASEINFGGGVVNNFNLALLTVDRNLVLAIDSTDPTAQVKLWYDDDAELTKGKSAIRTVSGYVSSELVAINY